MLRYEELFKAIGGKTSIIATLLFFLALPIRASMLGLEWEPNTEADLAGYRVYFGTFSMLNISTAAARANPNIGIWEVSKTTTTDIYLQGGKTYYFRMTAFDQARNESGFNVEMVGDKEQDHELSVFLKSGDINSDGTVDARDLQLIVNQILSP